MELLRDIDAEGFPADYLLARVRGRRARLVADWSAMIGREPSPGASDEAIWGAFLAELEWLHAQMDRGLRARLAPVFVLFEIKTMVLCLRSSAAQRPDMVERLLSRSLLCAPLKRALAGSRDARSAVAAVTELLAGQAPGLAALEASYAMQGLRGFEDDLVRGYLAHVAKARLHPVVAVFFSRFIDLRNLMLLYKHVRWRIGGEIACIPGGRVDPALIRDAASRGDLAGVEALARQATDLDRLPAAASEGALESVLLASMTRELRRTARAGDEVAIVLDYAWRTYIQARNLAVLHHARGLDRDTLERELIA